MCENNCCETSSPMQIGKPAPSFEMEGYYKGEKKRYKMEDYAGKWKILFFLLLASICLLTVWHANRTAQFHFMLIAVGAGYVGLTYLFIHYTYFDILFWYIYFIATCVALIRFLKKHLRRK